MNLEFIAREVIAMVIVPALLILMWWQWTNSKPAASWRSGLAVTSSILLSVAWLLAASWDVPVNFRVEPLFGHLHFMELASVVRILQAVGFVLAFAHTRLARIFGISAAVLFLVWPLGYV